VGAVKEWKLTTILQPSSVNIGLLSRTHLHSWYNLDMLSRTEHSEKYSKSKPRGRLTRRLPSTGFTKDVPRSRPAPGL
jgi:hypothetical protein